MFPEEVPDFETLGPLAPLYVQELDEAAEVREDMEGGGYQTPIRSDMEKEVDISPSMLLHLLLQHGAVFARMKPEQKALLVEHFMGIGYCTAMVGDGANDCQSLKTAEVWLDLLPSARFAS